MACKNQHQNVSIKTENVALMSSQAVMQLISGYLCIAGCRVPVGDYIVRTNVK
jgi:hypothetical protein